VSLPKSAKVRAVPNFLRCLAAARAFMIEQDAPSAPSRFAKLQAELARARKLLAFEPSGGRPARFLQARTAWGHYQSEQALQLAASLGSPELRELVLAGYVLLYAHSDREVVLLALRHERQLAHRLLAPT
jgi:hypothetical protein